MQVYGSIRVLHVVGRLINARQCSYKRERAASRLSPTYWETSKNQNTSLTIFPPRKRYLLQLGFNIKGKRTFCRVRSHIQVACPQLILTLLFYITNLYQPTQFKCCVITVYCKTCSIEYYVIYILCLFFKLTYLIQTVN